MKKSDNDELIHTSKFLSQVAIGIFINGIEVGKVRSENAEFCETFFKGIFCSTIILIAPFSYFNIYLLFVKTRKVSFGRGYKYDSYRFFETISENL